MRDISYQHLIQHKKPQVNQGFTLLKKAFPSAHILKHPDPPFPYVVQIDAESYGHGNCAFQTSGKNLLYFKSMSLFHSVCWIDMMCLLFALFCSCSHFYWSPSHHSIKSTQTWCHDSLNLCILQRIVFLVWQLS